MKNIYDLANELSRTLRELPEYQAVAAAKVAIKEDARAHEIFTDYVAFQTELQTLLQTGQAPDEHFQKKMEEFAGLIQGNPLLSDFFSKQQQLSVYLSDLERIIFEPVQDLLR